MSPHEKIKRAGPYQARVLILELFPYKYALSPLILDFSVCF